MMSFLFIFVTAISIAKTATSNQKPADELKMIVARYQKAKGLELQVEKKTFNEALGNSRTLNGLATITKKYFRFESELPEKILVLFDGNTLWNIQFPKKNEGGKTQAAKAKIKSGKRSQLFMIDFFNDPKWSDDFEIKKLSQSGDLLRFSAKAKKSSDEIKNIEVSVDIKDLKIIDVSYSDELDNKVSYRILSEKILKKINLQIFKYHPGKDVEVTQI